MWKFFTTQIILVRGQNVYQMMVKWPKSNTKGVYISYLSWFLKEYELECIFKLYVMSNVY